MAKLNLVDLCVLSSLELEIAKKRVAVRRLLFGLKMISISLAQIDGSFSRLEDQGKIDRRIGRLAVFVITKEGREVLENLFHFFGQVEAISGVCSRIEVSLSQACVLNALEQLNDPGTLKGVYDHLQNFEPAAGITYPVIETAIGSLIERDLIEQTHYRPARRFKIIERRALTRLKKFAHLLSVLNPDLWAQVQGERVQGQDQA